MTVREFFEFFFEGQSIETIIYCCFIITGAFALLVSIIYFFIHSSFSDYKDGTNSDSNDENFWMAVIFLDCLQRDLEEEYAEIEEEALKNDPDSIYYDIY